jgi:sulfite reductase (NADPH) flavoprotein alpha-component
MTTKKILFQLHWFFGISAGLILAIMGVTGAIYSYEEPIIKWINPDSFTVTAQPQGLLTPTEIYQRLSQQFPDKKINTITVTSSPTEAASVNFAIPNNRRGETKNINPYTTEILPDAKGEGFFHFIEDLHRRLTMGEFGKQLTGASTLILIYFVLSGIYLRWPRKSSWKEWFVVKSSLKGRSFLWNLHAVAGTWMVIFYLSLSLTGLYWSYDWYRAGMFKVMGVEQPKPQGAGQMRQPDEKSSSQRTQNNNQQGEARRGDAKKAPIDVPVVLTQSWQVFQQNVSNYSTASFKIPDAKSKSLDITFLDAEPAHERARNTLKYDFKNQKIKELSLYEDKKLNEKIMSSMLPVHRGNFFGPVWQLLTMLAALSMPLFFVTGWMLYLKRRKQKKLTKAAQASAPHSTSLLAQDDQQPWLIVYASQTGFAEQIAWRTAQSLQHAQIPAQVVAIDKLDINQLKSTENALFVISTYGQGEPPDHARRFAKKHLKQALTLPQLNFAVLALGDMEYQQTYCDFGLQTQQWLSACKAKPFFDLIKVNNGHTDGLTQWNEALGAVTHQQLDSMIVEKVFDHWQISNRQLLNPNSVGEPAFEVQLTAQHDVHWSAGDIAEIQCGNSVEDIHQFLNAQQLAATQEVELKNIKLMLFDALRYLNLRNTDIQAHSAQQWVDQLPALPTREYSIASIPQNGYLGLVVRQNQTEHGLGLGSGWLTAHTALAQNILLRIRHNESFHAPDDNRPLILIGNGTGIAGLLSILRYRAQHGFNTNWLIFGERQQQHDFFFQNEIEAWQAEEHLQRVDLAFSRDQAQRVYVQHLLAENAEILKIWVNQGASIYVCGSIDTMAPAVDQVLTEILGELTVEELTTEGRYRRDVY